eukprot:62434_1
MAVEIACVLLLSTMLWDLSSGGKGGLQSHREPLSILGLAAVVVYFYISVFFYTRIESYSGKWYKSIITSIIPRITSITVSIIATFNYITTCIFNITFNTIFIISSSTLIRTSITLFTTSIIIPIGTTIDTPLIRSMTTPFSKSLATAIRSHISLSTIAIRTSCSTLFIASISMLIITPITKLISTSFSILFGISIITSFSKPTGENLATSTTQLDRSQQRHRAHKSIVVHDGAFTNTSTKGELITARAHKSIDVHDGAHKSINKRITSYTKSTAIALYMTKNKSNHVSIIGSNFSSRIKTRKETQKNLNVNSNRKQHIFASFNYTYDCFLKHLHCTVIYILALNEFVSMPY